MYWQTQDQKTLKRINKLIQDTERHPFEGVGKPEPLRGNLSGYLSRHIDDVNRLVYSVKNDSLIIVAFRTHYGS